MRTDGQGDPGSDPAEEWAVATLRRHTITLDLPRKPVWLSMNQYRRAHKQVQAQATRDVRVLVNRALQNNPVCPRIERANITVTMYAPNKARRDADGLGALGKDVLDALVACNALPDDSWRYVDQVAYRIRIDKDDPRITIELEEIE